jgi:hypothetical protein
MNVMPEPQTENRFPDCVAMKIHVEANTNNVSKAAFLPRFPLTEVVPSKEANLSLTINFSGEQEIEVPGGKRLGLPGGRVTFGLKRGQLRFIFQNCKLPLEKIALSKPFRVSIEVEQERTKSDEIQAAATLETRSVGAKAVRGSTEKTTVEVFQVKKIGSEDQPAWIFETHDDRMILEGTLKETLLGILHVMNLPCEVNADFTVRGEDIQITWGQIGMAQNIHRNRSAVIERAIALRYIKPMVEASPLCTGRWRHG